jgi:hypothetical protein
VESRYTHETQLDGLSALQPQQQAHVLSAMAREARLLELALDGAGGEANDVVGRVERALELAMDASGESEATHAHEALTLALASMKDLGLAISAGIGRMEIDGLLGPMHMPVLTAIVAPISAQLPRPS